VIGFPDLFQSEIVMPGYPIGETCPKCSSSEYTTTPSDAAVSYAPDRICSKCGTRYTPPTPRWAAITFILAGVILIGLVAYGFLTGSIGHIQKFFLTMMAFAAVGFGVVSLRQSKQQPPAPSNDQSADNKK
jgi:hypothetical protein